MDTQAAVVTELQRRAVYLDRVRALFESRPMQWIPIAELAAVGGLAWRSRVVEFRIATEKDGGSVPWNRKNAGSAYMYKPADRLF